ncbi:MAG: PLD nuclease N-terminal domain-containing protein [Coriobacteriia bacterium]|jgi:hypothetical protein|nr:PLD nuclease N-terminal domain-containing protein [Coriobacteriia bacterium]
MIQRLAESAHLPVGVVWGLVALAVLQVAVQIWALVDLSRRPRVRFDKKWVWALVIIVFGNSFIGPIIYAAIGRNGDQQGESALEAAGDSAAGGRTARAVATLYGPGAAEDGGAPVAGPSEDASR